MKIKTAELTGAALDWAVYQCEEQAWNDYDRAVERDSPVPPCPSAHVRDYQFGPKFNPSVDWSQGGQIIERERIYLNAPDPHGGNWAAARFRTRRHEGVGATPLIAAMRCFVASKLGEEVDVPEELLK